MRQRDRQESQAPTSIRHRVWRCVLHIPVGLVTGALVRYEPALGLVFGLAFLAYEMNEDRWIRDQAWQDIMGWMVGMVISPVAVAWCEAHGIWARLVGVL